MTGQSRSAIKCETRASKQEDAWVDTAVHTNFSSPGMALFERPGGMGVGAGGLKRERGGDRERERDTDRQTDRQAGRQRQRQRDRQAGRHAGRQR